MTEQTIEVRKAQGNVRWIVAWSAVATLFVIGLLGAFTVGAFVLPVAAIAALVVAVLWVRAARATAPPGPSPWSPGYASTSSISSTAAHFPISNPLTTIALVLSLASILVAPLAFAGLITGFIALREIRESGGAQAGSGRAVAAIVISAVIAVVYVTLMVAVFLPR